MNRQRPKHTLARQHGITLMEILVVISIIAIVSAILFVAFNPAGQLAQSRNRKRLFDLETIMNAVRQNIADQTNQKFSCSSGALPTSTTDMAATSGYNIAPCLIGNTSSSPTYIYAMPFDPSAPGAHYTSNADYDTGYSIYVNSSTGQITLSAPSAEASATISIIR